MWYSDKRKQARDKHFNDYKNKWGFTDYRFFVYAYGRHDDNPILLISHNSIDYMQFSWERHSSHGLRITSSLGTRIFEIRSLHTLLNRLKCLTYKIFLFDAKNGIEFNSFEELKRNQLIRKLAGV